MERRTEDRPLDRTSPLPLWSQLETDLKSRIEAGEFDSRFPGEHELVAEYKVSRHTVRDALRRLRTSGVLESGRGRGTWLRPQRIEQPLGALYSLFRSVEARGLEQRSEVHVLDVRMDGTASARLDRTPDTEFVYLERLRLADGEPLAVDRSWIPRSIAGPLMDADFTRSGLYDQLAALTGIRLTGGREIITAVVPDANTGELLKIPNACAAMKIRRLGCLRGRPVEWRETVIRGDRFSVTAQWSTHENYRMNVASGESSGLCLPPSTPTPEANP